jgi:hypothetical protein
LCWLLVVVRRQETLQVLVEAALALFMVTKMKEAKVGQVPGISNAPKLFVARTTTGKIGKNQFQGRYL